MDHDAGRISHLDGAADALEVVGHVQGQHHVLLQQPFCLDQARYIGPAHASGAVYDIPAPCQLCRATTEQSSWSDILLESACVMMGGEHAPWDPLRHRRRWHLRVRKGCETFQGLRLGPDQAPCSAAAGC